MVETPGAPLIRTYRRRLPGDMRGVVLTDQSVEELQTLAERLGLPAEGVPAALALAEQLRLVSTGLSVSDEALSAQKEHPYSEDLADLAGEVRADIGIGMATKGPTARPYNQGELLVLLGLYRVAQVQSDIITCFQLLSKRSRHALGERVRVMMAEIQRLSKGPS